MADENLQGQKAFLDQAEALFANGLYREAAEAAESRLRDRPADMDANVILCRAYVGMERMQEAMRCLAEIEDALLGFSRLYATLGDLCRRKGLRDEATVYYRKFLALHPHSSITEEVNGHLDELLRETFAAKPVDGTDVEAMPLAADFQTVTAADLYVRQGHLEEAAELLERILQRNPEDPQAAKLISEVREKMAMRTETPEKGKEGRLLDELQRWLDNIERMRPHGT